MAVDRGRQPRSLRCKAKKVPTVDHVERVVVIDQFEAVVESCTHGLEYAFEEGGLEHALHHAQITLDSMLEGNGDGRFARKAWGPVSRLLRRDTGLGRELSDMDAAFRAEPALADNLLRPLMKDGVLPPDIFNHAGIEAVLAEQYAGNGSHWNLISQLVSWGLGAQFFLHDDFSRVPKSMYAPGAL